MRILSARVIRARRLRALHRVEAVVMLLLATDGGGTVALHVATSAPTHAPDAAPLRDRLIASAKLRFVMKMAPEMPARSVA